MILQDYPFKVYGIKLVKSEPIVNNTGQDGTKGSIVWNGINIKLILGQFKEESVARNFARNVKNNTQKKHWRISLINDLLHMDEEIGYTEKEEDHYRRQKHFYDRR